MRSFPPNLLSIKQINHRQQTELSHLSLSSPDMKSCFKMAPGYSHTKTSRHRRTVSLVITLLCILMCGRLEQCDASSSTSLRHPWQAPGCHLVGECVVIIPLLLIDYKLSTICHNFFSNSSPANFSDLLTVYTPDSFVFPQTVSPMLEQKPLANAVSPPVFQNNGIHSLLTSVTFSPLTPSKLR